MISDTKIQLSWGRAHRYPQQVCKPLWRHELEELIQELRLQQKILAAGLGRSYGDVGLNQGQCLIDMTGLDRILEFDSDQGRIKLEAGVSIRDLNRITAPRGWFIPVTPGTSNVTLGGAVANDVHGKNHHSAGTLGCHVLQLGLLRSNESEQVCSHTQNPDLFSATIGGMGLTGLITWVEIQLLPIESFGMETETLKFNHLSEFFEVSKGSSSWPYTVSWIDCFAPSEQLGRGLFSRARHAASSAVPDALKLSASPNTENGISVPIELPAWGMNKLFITQFNRLYFHRQRAPKKFSIENSNSFFYPLDKIQNWNRLYGPQGFFQFQCVVPVDGGENSIRKLLETIRENNQGSFLAVLKEFGNKKSPGMLSFPQPGYTLALDFPNRGRNTIELIRTLHQVTHQAGGRIYPAKDSHLTADEFFGSYPGWEQFGQFIDDAFESSFFRRVLKQID